MTSASKPALALALVMALSATIVSAKPADPANAPNIVFVFADQWRGDALGYAGDPNVKTPNLDRLAEHAVNFTNAVSGCPVCCPYRATLMTGRFCSCSPGDRRTIPTKRPLW